MTPHIRPARLADAFAIAHVHHGAVHGLAAAHYPPELRHQWARPVDRARAERMFGEAEAGGAVQLVAELEGAIVGVANVLPAASEIVACYVLPAAARRGVGSRLLAEMEAIARRAGCAHLALRASLNAADFYRAHGYIETGRGEHRLADGAPMAAVFMRKDLG